MTNPIHLDNSILARAAALAAERNCTIEDLLGDLVTQSSAASQRPPRNLIGLFADEPDLVDRIMDDVNATRESQALRV